MTRDARRSFAPSPSPRHRRGRSAAFTLIEMLVATVLSAVLMTAVLAVLAGVARDRRAVRGLRRPTAGPVLDLIEWDLRNAAVMSRGTADVLSLVGNDGIDRGSLAPDGRRVRVTYRAAGTDLWRQQEYLDDPARPAPWQERVAGGFQSLSLRPPPGEATPVPPRVTVDLVTTSAVGSREVTR